MAEKVKVTDKPPPEKECRGTDYSEWPEGRRQRDFPVKKGPELGTERSGWGLRCSQTTGL